MTNIIEVHSISLITVDSDGTSHWKTNARIADAVITIPAQYHPAELASPDEYCPANCVSLFQLEDGDPPPPIDGTQYDQIQYLDNLSLDWDLIDSDF